MRRSAIVFGRDMPEKIFINYRRDTDKDAAGRLRDWLERSFPADGLFIDVDNIRPGKNFVEEISASLAQCDIFIAVIGPNWSDVLDRSGRRRLENPNDWVRIEIEEALRQQKVIIPVLINHAEALNAQFLPSSLASFTQIHAARLTYERYGADVGGLVKVIQETREEFRRVGPRAAAAPWEQGDAKPDWASAAGHDQYGRWAAFEIGGVTQKMRWIPPGKFLMGSPEREAGRFPDEGPQHEVTFAKGFWLADTACTQALWTAVMGDNPSQFKGPNLPVETVSWRDAQQFFEKINRRIFGLDASLPSEAQWEYACRAGMAMPFSFGQTITPEQVNYNGNLPYAGAVKGLNRKKTVAVVSLPANAWGLFEMHGNVWEWAADAWRDDYSRAPTNGSACSDPGAVSRVVRGGSSLYVARLVRSAYRSRGEPGDRSDDIGFRCARVQA
jgi:formylglycine-generating enzyme required for sulfatase activity